MNNLESVVTYEGTADVHALVIGGALTGHPGVPLSVPACGDRIPADHHHAARARRAAPRDRRGRAAPRRSASTRRRSPSSSASASRRCGRRCACSSRRARSPTSRGAATSSPSCAIEDLEEIYELRRCSRSAPARRALPELDERGLERIALAADDCDDAAASPPTCRPSSRPTAAFTSAILDSPDQPHTMRLIRLLWDSTEAYRALYYNSPDERPQRDRGARRILAALRARRRRATRRRARRPPRPRARGAARDPRARLGSFADHRATPDGCEQFRPEWIVRRHEHGKRRGRAIRVLAGCDYHVRECIDHHLQS